MLCGPSGKQNRPPFFAEIGLGKQNLPPFFAEMTVGKQNRPPFFAEIGLGKQNRPPVSSENGKNCGFRGRNHQKTEKTAFHPRMMREKQQKQHFIHGWWGKNRKNSSDTGVNRPFLPKTAFLPREKVRITHFLRFPLEKKSKSPVFRVSP